MQKGQVQLAGIPFPFVVRDQGASVEILKLDSRVEKSLGDWARDNQLDGDRQWGIISQSKSKLETQFLSLSFRRVQKSILKFQGGRIERVQEETTEPEMGEFHIRQDGLLELYSYSARQKTALSKSLGESFGKDCLTQLFLQKDAMKSLMTEAIEVNSVSLTSLGNPFFNEATLAGTDPANSKTFKEFFASGEIKSFRGKFHSASDQAATSPLNVTVSSNCKMRFFGGTAPVSQAEIEEFAKKVADIAIEATEFK
jgi:hypothetical protein